MGEVDARGWAAWEASHQMHLIFQRTPSLALTDATDLDPYRQWAAKESLADKTCLFPTRSSDDAEDADPYSTIVFSDVRPVLLDLRSRRGRNAFRLAWLSFLGLHIPGHSSSLSASGVNWDDRWNCDYLTHSSYLNALFPADAIQRRLGTEAVSGVIVGREREFASGFGPVRCWGFEVFGALDTRAEVWGKGSTGIWRKEEVSELDEGLVRRVFAQLRIGNHDFEWDVLALAFETAIAAKR